MRPFRPRAITYVGVHESRGWQLKRFSISFDGTPVDFDRFAAGIALADAALPQPARQEGRAGIGFLIAHHGRAAEYVILGWWDRDNELPLRVFVRTPKEKTWRPSRDSESLCVWDLEVIWAERQAYVDTVMTYDPDPDAYLARHGGWALDEVPA
jgi:hypothetical protein